jgi:hypothetical protein
LDNKKHNIFQKQIILYYLFNFKKHTRMQHLLNKIIDIARQTHDLTTIKVKCREFLLHNSCTWKELHEMTITRLIETIAIPVPNSHNNPLDAGTLASFLKSAVDAFPEREPSDAEDLEDPDSPAQPKHAERTYQKRRIAEEEEDDDDDDEDDEEEEDDSAVVPDDVIEYDDSISDSSESFESKHKTRRTC